MGYLTQSLKLLLKSNQERSFTGNFLSIGKQSVAIENKRLFSLINRYGFHQEHIMKTLEQDKSTRNAHGFSDDSLLKSLFPKIEYSCLDRSNYEGAEIIQDMNLPINTEHNAYDLIYNGSCMDNLFNPYQFLVNCSSLLNSNGRIFHIEAGGSFRGAYLMYSPEYFMSFYAANNFKNCEVYFLITHEATNRYDLYCDWFQYSPYFERNVPQDTDLEACRSIKGTSFVLVIAEKGEDSTNNKIPTQLHYMDSASEDWRKTFDSWEKPKVENLFLKKRNIQNLPYNSSHFTYIGSELLNK